ncbi:hypothetical protein [Cytobacillus firmus]|uniref:hypothetical protein n=1 Tax=Cytobacillus firmus TaxID=1399 RepID=UPI001C96C9A3|nr:hypothetical protein [Cytobacillus firmus]MBY6052780.1 hypothetical protein [Cytobacillus firmus]
MRIKFEEWLIDQEIGIGANDLFEESIICYKASAYRAALLFSFLGFQTIIKQRIINSKPANDYQDGEWNQLKKDLLNDDKWDKLIIEIIQNKKKPIFNITEDLREQYSFWKNRRNDCAHAKGNAVSYPHVEGFWLFIQSNLAKFVVNGGMKFILQEIRNHFDPARTPAETAIEPIIKQIPFSIDKVDYKEFLLELKDFSLAQHSKSAYLMIDKNIAEMWYQLFKLPENYFVELVDFLVKDHSFCLTIIRRKPEMVKYFNNKETFIRMLWKKDLSRLDDYKVFIELLRHNLIPESQLNESFEHIFSILETPFFDEDSWWLVMSGGVNDLDKMVLLDKGFFTKFNEIAFEGEKIAYNFNWGNRNKELVIYYINEFGLNETLVTAINKALTSSNPPFKLRDELSYFYKNNQQTLELHIEISEKLSLKVPKLLSGLLAE